MAAFKKPQNTVTITAMEVYLFCIGKKSRGRHFETHMVTSWLSGLQEPPESVPLPCDCILKSPHDPKQLMKLQPSSLSYRLKEEEGKEFTEYQNLLPVRSLPLHFCLYLLSQNIIIWSYLGILGNEVFGLSPGVLKEGCIIVQFWGCAIYGKSVPK